MDSLKKYHPESQIHSLRVGLISIELGSEIFSKRKDLKTIGYAGFLHDIGKLDVPENILSAESTLSPLEKDIMKTHPYSGLKILNSFHDERVGKVVVAHHEFKKDPYPRKGLDRRKVQRGEDRRAYDKTIEEMAQIVAISDLYDALLYPRAYRGALKKQVARSILRTQYTGHETYLERILRK